MHVHTWRSKSSCGCDSEGVIGRCGRWVQDMEGVKIEGVRKRVEGWFRWKEEIAGNQT